MTPQPGNWLVSVDDHLVEPPNLWVSRIASKYHGTCPHVREDDLGEAWFYEGKRLPVSGTITSAGIPSYEVDPGPIRYSDMDPACYSPTARIGIMDRDGVLASLPFPTLPRFCGQEFLEGRDKELALLCVKAYNDFILDEWARAAPDRLIPMIILPLWDPVIAAREIERCADKGAKSIAFSEFPPALGLPSIHDPRGFWDPVLSAANDARLPLSIHIGSSSRMPNTSADAPRVIMSVLLSWTSATTAVDWMFSNAFVRFPNLRLTLSEGGIGWIPFMLERVAWVVEERRFLERHQMRLTESGVEVVATTEDTPYWPHGEQSPLEVYSDHIRGCFIAKFSMAREVIASLGPDLFLAETDYPHGDSTYPETATQMDKLLAGLNGSDQTKLRQSNAIAWYNLDHPRLQLIESQLCEAAGVDS